MRISHQHRFVFLALPRTGSTAMRHVLDPYADIRSVHRSQSSPSFPFYHHISAPELKHIFEQRGWDWCSYRKFCVVRNPFDRVVSLYHHRLSPPAQRDKECSILHKVRSRVAWWLLSPSSFEEFVEGIDPISRLTTSLDHFAFDASGNMLVDTILPYERLAEDGPQYLRSLRLPGCFNIPHANASLGRRPYGTYYDVNTRRRVASLYNFEIERFGYRYAAAL